MSESVIARFKDWILKHIPRWSEVQIVDCARYSGAFLGPKSAHVTWQSPVAKWSNRTATISTSGAPTGLLVALYNTRALTTLSYVAQFSLPPESIHPRERALLGRLLHLPGNAMASSDLFSLARWGSYEIQSAFAMSLAILMRSALVTSTTWPSMLEVIKRNDAEFFEVHRGKAVPCFKPKHWDGTSIVELLQEAALGYPSSKKVGDAGKTALAAFRHERSKSNRFPHGLHTIFYNIFLEALYPDSIPKLITKRLRVLDPGTSLPSTFDFDSFREATRTFPHYIVFTLIRCWANGWTTSKRMKRMHEPRVHSCLFGCRDVQDDLSHYLRCERFWRALKSALKATSTTGPLATNAPMLEKLAITVTSDRLVCNLCALSHGYHTLKSNYQEQLLHANASDIAKITVDVLKAAVLRFQSMLPRSSEQSRAGCGPPDVPGCDYAVGTT